MISEFSDADTEISDIKAFAITKENSYNSRDAILRKSISILDMLGKIVNIISKYGIKSRI